MKCALFGYFLLLNLPVAVCIQCYAGAQLQIVECPALSCIKQTIGVDTVRYCDGMGMSSICQTYRIFETCDQIPNLGFVCCCSGDMCNSAAHIAPYKVFIVMIGLFLLTR